MGRAKEIIVKVINSTAANVFIKKHHYSAKVVNNSQLHFGAFLDGGLHGVMSFGPSMDKSKIQTLVSETKWYDFIELNRMAFDDYLPRNSESRCIGVAMRLLKKKAPNIKWVVSFSDGCQCGDGTIYRASGFVLTQIKENTTIIKLPDGKITSVLTFTTSKDRFKYGTGAKLPPGTERLKGYQLRYIYFIDPSYKEKLTCPIIPFSKINEVGASMYKGSKSKPIKHSADAPDFQSGERS